MDSRIKTAASLQATELEAAGSAAGAVRCFRLISLTSQKLRTLFDQRLREEGLTTQQGVLLTIVRTSENATLSQIAEAMGTSHQNVKQVARALERKGFVRFAPHARDKRATCVLATEAGRKGWAHRDKADFAAVAEWFSVLSRAEQDAMAKMLTKLAKHLG